MDASSFYTDKYDEELMISVKTSEECNGPTSLKYIEKSDFRVAIFLALLLLF